MKRICQKNSAGTARFVLKNAEMKRPLFFIGINPSLADDTRPDPTWHKMEAIAQYNGFDGVIAINLSPEITPRPSELHLDDIELFQKNLTIIQKEIEWYQQNYGAPKVWCGWGAKVGERRYQKLQANIPQILQLFPAETEFYVLPGLTQNGNPRHPLYAKSQSRLVHYR